MNAEEYNRQWLEKLRARALFGTRAWLNLNRARKRGAIVDDTIDNAAIARIFAYYGNRCVYCGEGGYMELEHFYPLSKGGHHVRSNLVPACIDCNRAKGCMPPDVFLLSRPNAHPALAGKLGPQPTEVRPCR